MGYILGLDCSTTAVKAVILDVSGNVVAESSSAFPTFAPNSLRAEQNPEDWWTSCQNSIRTVLINSQVSGSSILGIGITGQMSTLAILDENDRVIRPALVWSDRRSARECDLIRQQLGDEFLLNTVGNLPSPGNTVSKLLWVRNNESKNYKKIDKVFVPKDYIRYRLTGERVTDPSDASGMLLLNVRERKWSDILLDKLEFQPDWFPIVKEGTEIVGEILPEASERTGLSVGTPIIAGGADQATQAISSGVIDSGAISLSLGASGDLLVTTDKPVVEEMARLRCFCYCLPKTWYSVGITLSAGDCLRWIGDIIFDKASNHSLKDLMLGVDKEPPGCRGLIFLPYLSGVRTPNNDAFARGSFIGLTTNHNRASMIRAVMEGVAFSIRDGLELFEKLGLVNYRSVKATGGGISSTIWCDILANSLNMEIIPTLSNHGSAIGAALMAGVSTGLWDSFEATFKDWQRNYESFIPNPKSIQAYNQVYSIYSSLYRLLKTTFNKLAVIENLEALPPIGNDSI